MLEGMRGVKYLCVDMIRLKCVPLGDRFFCSIVYFIMSLMGKYCTWYSESTRNCIIAVFNLKLSNAQLVVTILTCLVTTEVEDCIGL
jgi:hypothetical protein